MEEKLKNFGDLLKESLANRGEDISTNNSDSTTLSDAERNAILEKVVKSNEDPVQPPSTGTNGNDEALVPFGVLLERTVKLRTELESEDKTVKDEIREEIIKSSKMKLAEDLLKKLIG